MDNAESSDGTHGSVECFTSSGRRRSVVNYNVAHLTNISYQQALEERRRCAEKRKQFNSGDHSFRKAPKPPKPETVKAPKSTKQVAVQTSFDKLLNYEHMMATQKKNGRLILKNLCGYAKFDQSSGGFLLFLKTCTSDTYVKICELVEKNTLYRGRRDCQEWKARLVRYVWCALSPEVRRVWDYEARKLVKEAYSHTAEARTTTDAKAGDASSTKPEVEIKKPAVGMDPTFLCDEKFDVNEALSRKNSMSDHIDRIIERNDAILDKANYRSCCKLGHSCSGNCKAGRGTSSSNSVIGLESKKDGPAMPRCDSPFQSTGRLRQIKFERLVRDANKSPCPICKRCVPYTKFVSHLRKNHTNVQLYGCHVCFEAFQTVEALKSHVCSEFALYSMELMMKDQKFKMCFAAQSLVCRECNLQLPVPRDVNRGDFRRKLRDLLLLHDCSSLVSCMVYFALKPPGLEYVTIKNASSCDVPLCCRHCDHRYVSVDDMEQHHTSKHPDLDGRPCPVCAKILMTDFVYRAHVLDHFAENTSMVPLIDTMTSCSPSKAYQRITAKKGNRCSGKVKTGSTHYEVTDNEDTVILLQQRKRRIVELTEKLAKEVPAKKNEKKITKRATSDKCYNCRQLKLLFPKRKVLAMDCKCSSLSSIKKNPDMRLDLDDGNSNPLLQSLCDRFSKESRLNIGPVASFVDTTVGTLVLDSIFFCVKCCGLFNGRIDVETHMKACYQMESGPSVPKNDVDVTDKKRVIKLTEQNAPRNTRLSCPYCVATCCSITSLQRHFIIAHRVYAPFTLSGDGKELGVFSFVEPPKRQMLSVGELVNKSVGLMKDGKFVSGSAVPPEAAITTASTSAETPMSSIDKAITAVIASKEVPTVEPSPGFQNLVNSTKAKNKSSRKHCPVCPMAFDSPVLLADHFVKTHLRTCGVCGTAFTMMRSLTNHSRLCGSWPRRVHDGELMPHCNRCNHTLATPEHFFHHLIQYHVHEVRIDPETSEVTPMFIWKKLSHAEAAKKKAVYANSIWRLESERNLAVQASQPLTSSASTSVQSAVQQKKSRYSSPLPANRPVPLLPKTSWFSSTPQTQSNDIQSSGPLATANIRIFPLQQNNSWFPSPVEPQNGENAVSSAASTSTQTASTEAKKPWCWSSSSTSISTVRYPTDEQLKMPHCIMCSRSFSSENELMTHYGRHIENWRSCPVCLCSVKCCPVRTFPELSEHVVRIHARRVCSNKGCQVVCGLCYTSFTCDVDTPLAIQRLEEKMTCHVLFCCNAAHACFLCSNGIRIPPDQLETHRMEKHSLSYHRFGCSACNKKFFNCSNFMNHICNKKMLCSCGDRREFSDAEFVTHFEMHLNRARDFCLLCNKFLQSATQMEDHRNTHKKVCHEERKLIEYDFLKNAADVVEASEPPAKRSRIEESLDGTNPEHNNKGASMECEAAEFQRIAVKEEPVQGDSKKRDVLETPEKIGRTRKRTDTSERIENAVPQPRDFLLNVRTENDVEAINTRLVCESAVETVPAFEIPFMPESVEEIVISVVDDMLEKICGPPDEYLSDDEDVETLFASRKKSPARKTSSPASEVAADNTEHPQQNEHAEAVVVQPVSDEIQKASDDSSALTNLVENASSVVDDSDEEILVIGEVCGAKARADAQEENELELLKQERPIARQNNRLVEFMETNGDAAAKDGVVEPLNVYSQQGSLQRLLNNIVEAPTQDGGLSSTGSTAASTSKVTRQSATAQVSVPEGQGSLLSMLLGGPPVEAPIVLTTVEDDIEVVVEKTAPTASENSKAPAPPAVSAANDDDDELICLGSYQGPGLQNIRTRDSQVQCSRCTQKFKTQSALEIHAASHRYDAGNTLLKVLGLPVGSPVYLCRLCCLAYESREKYQQHAGVHGPLLNCRECSVVSFNVQQFQVHERQHQNPDISQRLTYVCTFCMRSYSTEQRLYHHMFFHHNQMLLYFCKCCGFSSTDGSAVYFHIAKNECRLQESLTVGDKTASMGFTAANIFHYQPNNPDVYERELKAGRKTAVVPSECIHRSFLMPPTEYVCVTCHHCCSLTGFLRVQTENPSFAESLPRPLLRGADDNDQLMSGLLQSWKKLAGIKAGRVIESFARMSSTHPSRVSKQATMSATPSTNGFHTPDLNTVQPFGMHTSVPQQPRGNIPWPQNVPVYPPSTVPPVATGPQPSATQLLQSMVAASTSRTLGQPQLPSVNNLMQRTASPIRQVGPTASTIAGGSIFDVPTTYAQQSVFNGTSPSTSSSSRTVDQRRSLEASVYSNGRSVYPSLQPNGTQRTLYPSTASYSLPVGHRPTVALPGQPGRVSETNLMPQQAGPSNPILPQGSRPTLTTHYTGTVAPLDFEYIRRTLDGKWVCTQPECAGIVIDKIAVAHVHCLRHKLDQTHFCLECGVSFADEQLAVKHQVMKHRDGKVPAIQLECPLCRDRQVYRTFDAFAEHLRRKLPDHRLLGHFKKLQGCALFFATVDAQRAHEADHFHAQSGYSSSCCVICGTAQQYWMTPSTTYVPPLSHSLLHAFDLWGMCRECGLCFAYDSRRIQFVTHYKQQHFGGNQCKICGIIVHPSRLREHAINRHFVVGIKSDRQKAYTVRVVPEMLLNYLGITPGDGIHH